MAPIQIARPSGASPTIAHSASRPAKPSACETEATASAASRRVIVPPQKSAAPHNRDEPRASAIAATAAS